MAKKRGAISGCCSSSSRSRSSRSSSSSSSSRGSTSLAKLDSWAPLSVSGVAALVSREPCQWTRVPSLRWLAVSQTARPGHGVDDDDDDDDDDAPALNSGVCCVKRAPHTPRR